MNKKELFILIVTGTIFVTIMVDKMYLKQYLSQEMNLKEKQSFNEEKNLIEKPLHLTPMCRGMFDLGDKGWANSPLFKSNITSFMTSLAKVKKLKKQITDHYDHLARMIPPMVEELRNGELYFSNITRLRQLNGQLPYLPCKIQHYESKDIKKCFHERQKAKKTFWIVYYGDSTARYPFLLFINETQKQFNWKVTEPKQNDRLTIHSKNPMKEYILEAKSSSGARLTYIRSVFGIHEQNNSLSGFMENISNDQNVAPIPDTIVLGIGVWSLWKGFYMNSHFKSFDMLLSNYKAIYTKLQNISKKTLILTISLTRKRLSVEDKIKLKLNHANFPAFENSNVDLIEQLKLTVTEETEVVHWDSSVAFNLAGNTECSLLVKNHTSISEDLVNRDRYLKLMCHDDIHKTSATLRDEIDMIVNYLCNDFQTPKKEHLCC